jgi:hypothetical protein
MLSLIVSTVAYFAASHYIKRYLDAIEAPRGFARNVLAFCAAALVAYGVAYVVDRLEEINDKHAAASRIAGKRFSVSETLPAFSRISARAS